MKALLVTFHFPPDAEIGAVRPHQFARYLPQYGVDTWVLTVNAAFAESPNKGLAPTGVSDDRIIRTSVDTTHYDRLKGGWRTIKTLRRRSGRVIPAGASKPPKPTRRGEWARNVLGFPDEKIGWYKPAMAAGETVIRKFGIDVIVSTSPPRVAAMVAASLAKRHGMPWVMDLRDPWWAWQSPSASGAFPLLKHLHHRRFAALARQASSIVHNTERLRLLTCRLVPDSCNKTRYIPNGCDPAWQLTRESTRRPSIFRIGYYGQIMGQRSPHAFLLGLRRWMERCTSKAANLEVRFIGSGFGEVDRHVQELGLSDIVTIYPPIPREEVPAALSGDFVLLLVANDQPLQVPGKTYEYLASGRRILALTEHDGATADLLKPIDGCLVAAGPEEVVAALDRFHQEFLEGSDSWIDRSSLLSEMHYPRRVERLAGTLRELIDARTINPSRKPA